MGQMKCWTMVGGRQRPVWAGDVVISDNEPGSSQVAARNPRSVHGIIVPVSTAGRGAAPKPQSGAATGASHGTDKGHMMALELGGPDISQNISPQTSKWQQSGGWRAVEVMALRTAMQWMQIDAPYDPADDIPCPPAAAYFRVSPLGQVSATQEPEIYEGLIVKVWPRVTGGYNAHAGSAQRLFFIKPGGQWCDRQGNPVRS